MDKVNQKNYYDCAGIAGVADVDGCRSAPDVRAEKRRENGYIRPSAAEVQPGHGRNRDGRGGAYKFIGSGRAPGMAAISRGTCGTNNKIDIY